MARFEFRLPDIGEGIAEAEIVAWHVTVGARIEEDAPLADMMTDKATVEMEAPVSGTVISVAGEVGDIVAIGSTLVVIETDAADDAADHAADDAASAPTVVEAVAPAVAAADAAPDVAAPAAPVAPAPATTASEPSPASSTAAISAASQRLLASPAVRGRASELGIDLAAVKPSADGRVRHADLDNFLRYNRNAGFGAPGTARADQTIKVVGMRRKIAENMSASKRAIPHFTYVEEIDVTALEAMRADLNANRGDRPKLTMLPLLIVAMCRALPEFPMLNARYDDTAGVVTRHGAVDLGMATQTDAGLMVPVLRDAQAKNVWQLATEITRLAESARNSSIAASELSGSTITITSLGPLGGVATTPVINRPEVAIIGPNRIIERPVFTGRGDEIRRAKLMNLSISCDHRVVDGWDAASFVQAIRRSLETPVLLFAD